MINLKRLPPRGHWSKIIEKGSQYGIKKKPFKGYLYTELRCDDSESDGIDKVPPEIAHEGDQEIIESHRADYLQDLPVVHKEGDYCVDNEADEENKNDEFDHSPDGIFCVRFFRFHFQPKYTRSPQTVNVC